MSLLEVQDLKVHFETDDGVVKAVDGVSFAVEQGQTLGIVGESGCGKSVANMTILGLTRAPNAEISGRIVFEGTGPERARRPSSCAACAATRSR